MRQKPPPPEPPTICAPPGLPSSLGFSFDRSNALARARRATPVGGKRGCGLAGKFNLASGVRHRGCAARSVRLFVSSVSAEIVERGAAPVERLPVSHLILSVVRDPAKNAPRHGCCAPATWLLRRQLNEQRVFAFRRVFVFFARNFKRRNILLDTYLRIVQAVQSRCVRHCSARRYFLLLRQHAEHDNSASTINASRACPDKPFPSTSSHLRPSFSGRPMRLQPRPPERAPTTPWYGCLHRLRVPPRPPLI